MPHPSIQMTITEPLRALLDGVASLANGPIYPFLRRGDGHAVLVLPGMLTDDWSTTPLRIALDRLGYRTSGWGHGINLGRKTVGSDLADLRQLVGGLREQTQGRKVSLIGMSLGGIVARELAKAVPESIRQVITLASPFNNPPPDSTPGKLLRMITGEQALDPDALQAMARAPQDVPCTAIYSRLDGVVCWRACREDPGPQRENIEIGSSHLGIGWHPATLVAAADRLGQTPESWQPFDRQATAWRTLAFADPAGSI